MRTERRTCPSCGNRLSGESDFCPVCLLRRALTHGAASGDPSCEGTGTPAPEQEGGKRFEHYELVKGEDGKPVELGRGAMGVTYKAFDIKLRRLVALKVISEKYLGDESTLLRFLREARAAASVRHPNVASVFHLGRTGQTHFYAMEFVDGETLEKLIKRSCRLQVGLALEIAAQVAAGLAAVHKQRLVHRDIKPSNIMVSRDEAGVVTAKIIDLGLSRLVTEQGSQTAISLPGAFVGTPDFASPEQYIGGHIDIRSDIYSLGANLWTMLTGQAPFRGTTAELMHLHLLAQLAIEQLEHVPQPVVGLLQVLLEKEPDRRFQDPTELLQAILATKAAIETGGVITRSSVLKASPFDPSGATREPPARVGPENVSVARLPVTGSDIFGREEDIAFLDDAWANQQVNIVTIVAWAGVGKSTLVNHWLARMAAEHFRSAQLVFGWSFYRQGTNEVSSSAEEFIDAALGWFGDPDPRIGTAWEKGERLARIVAHRRTLLILDGLEPLQYPPGPQEGRLREPSLQALLRELAAFNTGLCMITTRLPVADIANHECTSAPRRDLEHLSSEAGAKLLAALGVRGHEAELRSASNAFRGHCLALTLLGSYLTDACNGEIRCCEEVSRRLGHDVRQGFHARKVMGSYQSWFGEGPELSVLRILGLFDRPADEKALGALLMPPAIHGLTESLTDLGPAEWRTIISKLRRARLISREDPHNPGQLDTHPLVREYFGEQLRSRLASAWKECNRRLFYHYRSLAPQQPDSVREMEPLFLAIVYGCNAGLFREALHEVYIPRIQRGNVSFAANVLGARRALLSVLVHFFEMGRWGSPVEIGEGQSLTPEDQLYVLMQAAPYLTATRGLGAPEARICYERAESLCHWVNRPLLLYSALMGRWRHTFVADKLTAAIDVAKRVYSLAQEQNSSALLMGAYQALAMTLHYMGDSESAREYAMRGLQIWRSGDGRPLVGEVTPPPVLCLCLASLCEWHFGEYSSYRATMTDAMLLAKKLNDSNAFAVVLFHAALLAYLERNPADVESAAADLIEVSTRHNFALWLAGGAILRGWARSASGDTIQGISWIEDGIEDWRATGSILGVPFYLALKAEALYLADRPSDALDAITEAEAVVDRFEHRTWCAELHRLRGVFLTAVGAGESQIDASFCAAISSARQQRSISLVNRAEATYADYRHKKTSASGKQYFRLPLCLLTHSLRSVNM